MQTTFAVPRHVALCPHCGKDGELWLEVDEWEDGGVPTEAGCHVSCAKETERRDDIHWQMPYVYWLPLEDTVYRWAAEHVRIVPDEAEMREQLRAWNAGEPL